MKISDNFTFKKLLMFALPSILMMVFTSIYSIVDGFFVSNFVGQTQFASLNLIMPVLMILGSIGFMVGSGGSALISKTFGEGDEKKANEIFSLIIYFAIIVGIILAAVAICFIKPIAILLGAEGDMIEYASNYATIILLSLPFYILQYSFQTLLVTANKPQIGLFVTILAGVTNMVMDALLVAVFKLGLEGAALATMLSQMVGGVIPLLYFIFNKKGILHLGKTKFNLKWLLKVCGNGSSEFISNVSMSIVGIVFNLQLMKYYGQFGVSAYGVYMYVGMIFLAIFIGYSSGVAPVIGFNYGAKNTQNLKSLFKKSLLVIGVTSVLMTALGILCAKPLSLIFVSCDLELLDLTVYAMKLGSISFAFTGITIFASSFFTSLNDGLVSALISFIRTLICQLVAIIVLPIIFKGEGIWYSIFISEILASGVSIYFLISQKKKYQY